MEANKMTYCCDKINNEIKELKNRKKIYNFNSKSG